MAAEGALLLLLLLLPPTLLAFKAAGPYNVNLRSLSRCDDPGQDLLIFSTKLSRISPREYMYSGPWNWPYDLDDSWSVHLKADRWGSGGWGRNALSFDSKSPCKDAQKMCKSMFESLSVAAGFPNKCPIPAGNYTLNRWIVEVSLPFKHLLYGRYRIEIAYYRGGQRIGCMLVLCDIEEKLD